MVLFQEVSHIIKAGEFVHLHDLELATEPVLKVTVIAVSLYICDWVAKIFSVWFCGWVFFVIRTGKLQGKWVAKFIFSVSFMVGCLMCFFL